MFHVIYIKVTADAKIRKLTSGFEDRVESAFCALCRFGFPSSKFDTPRTYFSSSQPLSVAIRLSIVRTWYSCDSAFHCLNPSLSDSAFHCPNLVLLRFSFPLSEPIT